MLKNRLKYQSDCTQCSANSLCLPRDLDIDQIAELNALITNYKEVSKGEFVFHADEEMNYIYSVYMGSCKDQLILENGDMRIDNFYLTGDIIGLESIPNRRHLFSLVALEDSKLCMIPLDELFELMQKHESIMKRVFNITSYKMRNDQHVSMTTNANQRLIDFILNIIFRLEERNKTTQAIALPMSQIDIGLYLGMAHETVNRLLKKYQDDNILIIENKRIYVDDLDALKKLGSPISFLGQV